MCRIFILFSILTCFSALAQYAPPAGQAGSLAMLRDSSAFVAWASGCQVTRGPVDISDSGSGPASAGDPTAVAGKADGLTVSLGDGGVAICTFAAPVAN